MSTKYLVLVGDGMGDYPLDSLSGKTPLEAAFTPNMDYIASHGTMGLVRTIPEGKEAGSDIANLNIMGYDPNVYHTGRAPLEAPSMGIRLADDDVAYRCNLVILSFEENGAIVMEDNAAGHISNDAARRMIKIVERELGGGDIHFFPGVSYRHAMIWKNGREDILSVPPHDKLGQEVGHYLTDEQLSTLNRLVRGSWPLFEEFRKENPDVQANSIWLWGQGRAPRLPSFQDKYGLTGGVISAVDLLKGIGVYAGMKPIEVPGVTGFLDTNYAGKVEYALSNLEGMDFVYLHVEAPDEASHLGQTDLKVRAIEEFDRLVVGPALEGLKRFDHFRILLITDHFTPITVRTHTVEPVPFVVYDSKNARLAASTAKLFTEAEAEKQNLFLDDATAVMDLLVAS